MYFFSRFWKRKKLWATNLLHNSRVRMKITSNSVTYSAGLTHFPNSTSSQTSLQAPSSILSFPTSSSKFFSFCITHSAKINAWGPTQTNLRKLMHLATSTQNHTTKFYKKKKSNYKTYFSDFFTHLKIYCHGIFTKVLWSI